MWVRRVVVALGAILTANSKYLDWQSLVIWCWKGDLVVGGVWVVLGGWEWR